MLSIVCYVVAGIFFLCAGINEKLFSQPELDEIAWGLFFGLGSLYELLSNGILLGTVFGHMARGPNAAKRRWPPNCVG